jgi:nucleoside-diphosphate-sugar epimerase
MSPGEQIVDLTHVDDVVEAFTVAAQRLLAASEPLSEDFLLTGERLSVRDLASAVGASAGRRMNIDFGARKYRAREVMTPVDAADTLPGWHRRLELRSFVAASVGEAG